TQQRHSLQEVPYCTGRDGERRQHFLERREEIPDDVRLDQEPEVGKQVIALHGLLRDPSGLVTDVVELRRAGCCSDLEIEVREETDELRHTRPCRLPKDRVQ